MVVKAPKLTQISLRRCLLFFYLVLSLLFHRSPYSVKIQNGHHAEQFLSELRQYLSQHNRGVCFQTLGIPWTHYVLRDLYKTILHTFTTRFQTSIQLKCKISQ